MHENIKSDLNVGHILYLRKSGFNMIKEGAIGLVFGLVVGFFLVVRVLEVVVKFIVVRTYARTSKRY